jgi:hypothetical protein
MGKNALGISGDVSDEAKKEHFQPSEIELAKSEAVIQESLGLRPISANLRSLGLYTEDLSRPVRHSPKATFALRATARPQYEGRATAKRRRGEGGRDSVKVAQYEVLGNDAKRQVRPGRDDRIAWRLVSHAAQRLPASPDRPFRDG